MPYCTIDQLEDRYGRSMLLQLSDRGDTVPTDPDADLFARAIADADALIDGYLAARYALPLASTPALVTDLSQMISIYKAHGQNAPEKITRDHDQALRTLRDIANGSLKLDVAGVEPAGAGQAEVTTNEAERPFTTDKMKGFI